MVFFEKPHIIGVLVKRVMKAYLKITEKTAMRGRFLPMNSENGQGSSFIRYLRAFSIVKNSKLNALTPA